MNQHVDKSENLKLNRRRIFCTDAPQQLKYQNIKQLLCFAFLFNTIYDNYDSLSSEIYFQPKGSGLKALLDLSDETCNKIKVSNFKQILFHNPFVRFTTYCSLIGKPSPPPGFPFLQKESNFQVSIKSVSNKQTGLKTEEARK